VIRERVSPNVMLEPQACRAQLGSASIVPRVPEIRDEKWTLNQVQGDGWGGDDGGAWRSRQYSAQSAACVPPKQKGPEVSLQPLDRSP